MSAKISALLRATLPRYEAKPAVEEPAVVEVDDEVVELPKLIVTGDRPPIFSEREVQTKTGMAELVRKRYPGASFKGQPDQCPNYARLMYADDERRLLGPWRYEENLTLLHTDPRVMPRARRAALCWTRPTRSPSPASTSGSGWAAWPNSRASTWRSTPDATIPWPWW